MEATRAPTELHLTEEDHCATCQKRVCLNFNCACSEPGAVVDGKVYCPECCGKAHDEDES